MGLCRVAFAYEHWIYYIWHNILFWPFESKRFQNSLLYLYSIGVDYLLTSLSYILQSFSSDGAVKYGYEFP